MQCICTRVQRCAANAKPLVAPGAPSRMPARRQECSPKSHRRWLLTVSAPRSRRWASRAKRPCYLSARLAQAARPPAGSLQSVVRAERQEGQFKRFLAASWPLAEYQPPLRGLEPLAPLHLWAHKPPRVEPGSRVRPNPSLERTHTGMAPWPRARVVYHRPRGQGAMPARSAQLKR